LVLIIRIKEKKSNINIDLVIMGGWKQKTLFVTLDYVKIITLGINCILKNLREGKSRSGKGIKKGIGLCSFIK